MHTNCKTKITISDKELKEEVRDTFTNCSNASEQRVREVCWQVVVLDEVDVAARLPVAVMVQQRDLRRELRLRADRSGHDCWCWCSLCLRLRAIGCLRGCDRHRHRHSERAAGSEARHERHRGVVQGHNAPAKHEAPAVEGGRVHVQRVGAERVDGVRVDDVFGAQ